ncbi:hypothetical protein CcaCcLH18_11068 [Colletotrichum camelliae]|nr:hypothetical protein CcaCcLH18_11068 [Colletotrichum camelliae]
MGEDQTIDDRPHRLQFLNRVIQNLARCLDAYFKHKYPITPMLDQKRMEECSLAQVQTSFFLYCIYFCLNNDNAAWFYIREAMTILQTLRYHEEATYNEIADPSTKKYARRIFWVLFITERAYAMQRHRPLTLQPMLDLPQIDPLSPDAKILPGFLELISLFRPFDTDFIATWNSSTPSSISKSAEPEQLARLQNTLSNALANVSNFSPMQQADLLITREWLKVIVWKLCVSRTLLSGTDSEDSMSLSYPTTIARDTVLVSRLLPTTAFEANGSRHLGEVMDVGPIDILMETVRIAGQKFGDGYKHLDILCVINLTLKLDPHFLNLFVIVVLPFVDVNFVVLDEFKHTFGKQFRPAIIQQYTFGISYYICPTSFSITFSSGVSYSISYSTAPPTTDANGNQYQPVIPIAVPAVGGGPVVPPVGGGGGGGGGGADDTTTTSSLPSSTPLIEPSAAPSSAPPTSASTSSTQEPSSTIAAIDTTSSPLVVITFEPTTTTSIVEVVTDPAASTTTVAAPVPCYNYEWKSYGWCCPGPDSPCENSLGTCYFDGGGATNVLPNTAACPPAPDARHQVMTMKD